MDIASCFFAFIVPFVAVYMLTPFVRYLALQLNATDKKNNRKIHQKVITNLGGISIYAGFLLGLMTLYTFNISFIDAHILQVKSLVICSSIMLLLGIYDDLQGSSAYIKFIIQGVAALLLIRSGFRLQQIYIPGVIDVNFGSFSAVVTLLWLVGVTNAINLIDGLDGLATGILALAFLSLFVSGIIAGDVFVSLISLCLAGATMAFLKYNSYPAKIFLGDTGSLCFGFIVGGLAIYPSVLKGSVNPFLLPTAIILLLPILDTLFAIVRRIVKKQNIFKGDSSHIHHYCLKMGISHPEVVKRFYVVTALLGIISIGLVLFYRYM